MSDPQPVRVKEIRDEPSEEAEPHAALRLLIGGTVLAGRKLAELLAEWTEMAAREIEETRDEDEAASLRHLLIGLAATASRLVKTAADVARPAADRLLQRESEAGGRVPPPVRAFLEELAELGSKEENRSIALAHTAFSDAVERIFRALSESPELAGLIRDQSTSLGTEAVNELRDAAERVDHLSEEALRRLFGRVAHTND